MNLLRFYLVSFCAMLALAGCGGSSSTSNPPPPTIGKAYVAVGGGFSIMRYPAGGNGNISPENSIKLPSEEPGLIALDVAHDRLVAAANGSIPEVVFADNASTSMQPVRTISGAATTMLFAGHVAIDNASDLVYVGSGSSGVLVSGNILVFGPASTISGNVAPLRTISPGSFSIAGMALDVANNRLFLSDQAGFINVYDNASTLNGAVVPNRVITGAATQVVIPGALALDTSGRLIVANRSAIIPPFTNNILIFSNAGAINGNVAPAATATLAANQLAEAMAISPAGELYVVDGGASLTVYSNIATATGGLLPSRVISGPNTGLNPGLAIPPSVLGVAVDSTR